MKQKDVIPAGSEFIEKSLNKFSGSTFDRIGKEWMLITAGNTETDKSSWNTMTASWGGLGVLWGRDVAFTFIRPSRHTFGYANDSSLFTLSFFDESYRPALTLCGEKSGRDIDKAGASGLTPIVFRGDRIDGAVAFKEARDVFICKKLYAHDIDPALFLDRDSIEKNYHGKDYHRLFIGEIVGYRSR